MGPGRVESVKSRKYNPMVVAYVQVSHYNFNTRINVQNFCKIAQKFWKTTQKVRVKNEPPCWRIIKRIIYYPDRPIREHP